MFHVETGERTSRSGKKRHPWCGNHVAAVAHLWSLMGSRWWLEKLVIQRAREVHRKKWAAKHECEELIEGTWIEPVLVM